MSETFNELRAALMELIDMGEWTWSEADDTTLYTIHLRDEHYQELIELIARTPMEVQP